QNPAIIDCKGAGWNEIRQNATITEQLAYFEYLGFNEKPDNFEENRAYPIDLRNDEKDEGISFFLQIKTINKDTTPSFIKITAPQYYQNDRSFRKTKFINLDMLGYGTPSLFNDIGTTNFWATNLAHRHRFDSVIFENLNDDGGRGVTLFEKSVKKRQMHGTVVCAFDRENSYFKHANNHGDFNPDDRRIFYSLFDIEQDFKQEKTEKDKTMQQTQATQQTAAQGGFFSPKNYENTANYDVRGLPEFSGSVSAYFNNPKRQELVLAFLKTAERSKDLRSQVFLGIPYEEQKQFDRIAAFSPLELSAILDCKPEFANNLREYMAVVEDFERNHQQKLEDFKKALHALKISPKYQAATIRNRIFDENDLRAEYIDGGKAFAFTKTGEITNGDRLKQVIANAIDAIAPAVKYSLSQTEFWQERDDKAFIKQSQIRDLLRSQMSFPAELVEVKTLHQVWNDDRDMHDTISKSTAGFFTPKNGKTVVIADAFIENPELAVFTAYHELGHRGIELQGRELWNEWLEKARQNPTVRAIADHAQVHYAAKGNILSDIAATEEALVEVFAAYKTQNWDYLAQRHNVEISQEFRQPQGTAEKLWQSAKNKIGQIFGRQSETVSDAAVFAMLGKLEQSLYQFPEWKQKLEKAVQTEQGNPFVVAKQPSL
ncbi:MAG: hypothetical protein IJ881_03725, partial [Neisseriaceae bacterium]|nr:hypothetical protein [Neisseriaceae bacterium]